MKQRVRCAIIGSENVTSLERFRMEVDLCRCCCRKKDIRGLNNLLALHIPSSSSPQAKIPHNLKKLLKLSSVPKKKLSSRPRLFDFSLWIYFSGRRTSCSWLRVWEQPQQLIFSQHRTVLLLVLSLGIEILWWRGRGRGNNNNNNNKQRLVAVEVEQLGLLRDFRRRRWRCILSRILLLLYVQSYSPPSSIHHQQQASIHLSLAVRSRKRERAKQHQQTQNRPSYPILRNTWWEACQDLVIKKRD